jgi:hypothetical protein
MRLLPVTVMDAPLRSESSAGEPASPGSLHIELPKDASGSKAGSMRRRCERCWRS